jgi:hypothetical protein
LTFSPDPARDNTDFQIRLKPEGEKARIENKIESGRQEKMLGIGEVIKDAGNRLFPLFNLI